MISTMLDVLRLALWFSFAGCMIVAFDTLYHHGVSSPPPLWLCIWLYVHVPALFVLRVIRRAMRP